MAIFQPTNIIPSSFTQGTVDVNGNMEISWQVNGNSAMTAFQIDFYLNDTASTPVYSTGRLTDNCPFYGTDRFGRPQFFTWSPNGQTWEEWSKYQLTNGNNYKFKITQFYNEGNVEKSVVQTSFASFITRDTPTLTLYQTNENYLNPIELSTSLATSIGYFHADYNQKQGDPIRWIRWQIATVNNGVIGDILADTGDIYTPTLNYEFNGFFNGNQYAIRCMIETESEQSQDTGWVFFNINVVDPQNYTGVLSAKCVHNENATLLMWDGVTVITGAYNPPQDNSNEQYTFSNGAIKLPANSSVVWDNLGKDSNGAAVPMNFATPWAAVWKGDIENKIIYAGKIPHPNSEFFQVSALAYSPDGKLLIIGDKTSLSMYSVDGTKITYINSQIINQEISSLAFSPDGKTLIVGFSGTNVGFLVFAIDGATLSLIYSTTSGSQSTVGVVALSPDGKLVLMGGDESDEISIFSVGANVTFIGYLERPRYSVGGFTSLAFSPDGKTLIVGCYVEINGATFVRPAVYTVDGTTFTLITSIVYTGSNNISRITFSPDGKTLVLGGENSNETFIFSVNGATMIPAGTISRENREQCVSKAFAFSPDGNTFVMSYQESNDNYLSAFSVVGSTISFVGDLAEFNNKSLLPNALVFSPDGKTIVVGAEDGASTYSYSMSTYGTLLKIATKQNHLIGLNIEGFSIILYLDNTKVTGVPINLGTDSLVVIIGEGRINTFDYKQNTLLSSKQKQISFTQEDIASVSIYGGYNGTSVDNVAVYNTQESITDVASLYQNNATFEPVWNAGDYVLYMTANFNGNLEAGTGSGSGTGFRIYRQEVGKNVLVPIATVPANITSMKDYSILSRKAYRYSLYAYDALGAFMSSVEAENLIATNFKNYSLLVCDYDEDKDEYHVRKQYLFALNLSTGSVGNNNSPTLNANFTQFPTRMPSTQNYASGTLSGLIGAIYTVPALIEQIGQYKYTAKPSTLDYFDSVDLEKELYGLSTAPYQLFLRDMKGRLRMIATSGAISMTTNIKQKQQSISISLPWVEIGDASDVTIIQTPDDNGWNNDNQVLDVQLDVDVATGELSATYPFPYNGTKFYLTGANQENLTAKTPLGITPAQFNLSDVAEEPNDGEVTATVKVNTETN